MQIWLFITQASKCFCFINEVIKIQLDCIENLIISHAADNDIVIAGVIAGPAAQDEIEPVLRVRIKNQSLKFLISPFIKAVTGNDAIFAPALEFFTPLYRLFINGRCIKTASKINICPGVC